MSKKEERMKDLLDMLQKRQGVTIKELATLFDVSEMTIRRDIQFLKQNNLVLDIPGAAIINPNSTATVHSDDYSILTATTAYAKEKERIGRYAASLVEENDCVIIDNGTTTERMASALPLNLIATVMSSNLNIINRLAQNPGISIICGGGYYHPDTGLFESPESIALIKKTRATKVFCSAAGVHETMGVTCMNNYEVETKREIMASGAKKILLIDSSKFGAVKSCYVANFTSYDLIITDTGISNDWRERILSMGVDLKIV